MFLVRSGAIEGYTSLVVALGENPMRLLAAAGLSESLLRNPNTYLAYSKLAELLELTAAACSEPLFGLRLAGTQTSTVLGDVGVTISQQPSVRDAFASINKHLYLHARGVHVAQLQRGDDIDLELKFEITSPRGLNQLIQMSVGQLANFAGELLAVPNHTIPVLLRQPAPATDIGLRYGNSVAGIVFDANSNCIRLPAHWLERKPHHDEAALRRHFEDYIQLLEQRYPDNLQDQVRDIIGQALPSGECSLQRVADILDLHPRVLQKRLRLEGVSYVTLLQETRLTIAREHLRFKSMSITDLALNLGYADVSVFSRSFRKLTGVSARQWQAQWQTR
ncbi:MAG: AraC family transcriptional regulator ligand-binding domain-containing protein [Halioglobus sp.]|nr:AraC family transcriptional regulator ligand-binding domain-containing protein [Halioglobus sp.]